MKKPSPNQRTAMAIVNRGLRQGDLVKPQKCECCGRDDMRVVAHHADYAKPMGVQWVCDKCHKFLHKNTIVLNRDADPNEIAGYYTRMARQLAKDRWAKTTKAQRRAHAMRMVEAKRRKKAEREKAQKTS